MTDHSKDHYIEITGEGPYKWKVYHYDSTGNQEIIVKVSDKSYDSEARAQDAADEWCEDNGIEAEVV